MSSQYIILSYAAREDWEIHQVNIKGTYLNAKLSEMIYMKPLQGYLKQGEEGKVCHLLKGLYEIKQAGHKWYIELRNTFASAKPGDAHQFWTVLAVPQR